MIEWQSTRIPMRDVDEDPKDHVYVTDSPHVESATERIKKILDAKYEPARILLWTIRSGIFRLYDWPSWH